MLALRLIFLGLVLEVVAWGVPKISNFDERWQRGFLAPRDGPLQLFIALRLDDDGDGIEQELLDRSNPQSVLFRRWMNSAQVSSLAVPRQDSVHDVEYWLLRHDMLQNSTMFGGMLQIETTIRRAEQLLNTTYFVYSDGTRNVIRTERYHLPDNIERHVDFVTPTIQFPKPRIADASVERGPTLMTLQRDVETRPNADSLRCGQSDYTTPTCVRQIYDINHAAQPNRTTFAVYATEGASFSPSDLQTYLTEFNPAAAQANAGYIIDGAGASNETGGIGPAFKIALDTQTALGLAWPAHGTLFNRGSVFGPDAGQTYDNFVQFLHEMIHNQTVPRVVSFSESMPEDQMDPDYARRLCTMLGQVSARGVTLLFSSGDNGPNGDQPTGTHKEIFEPEFPASCPWVTAVGGTTDLANETAATQSTISIVSRLSYTASGGGFSNLFGVPNYQAAAARSYVVRHVPSSYDFEGGFNPRGRGIPDVSAFSTKFPTVVSDLTIPVGGTSASTPLWAAVVTLLNDYEASRGRPPLGFINPWLYALRTGFKDITTGGNNKGACILLSGCTLPETLGYNVTAGWDPVTGLGSPIFSQLTAALDAAAAGRT